MSQEVFHSSEPVIIELSRRQSTPTTIEVSAEEVPGEAVSRLEAALGISSQTAPGYPKETIRFVLETGFDISQRIDDVRDALNLLFETVGSVLIQGSP